MMLDSDDVCQTSALTFRKATVPEVIPVLKHILLMPGAGCKFSHAGGAAQAGMRDPCGRSLVAQDQPRLKCRTAN